MVQYASIDEAWMGCAPPKRYAPHTEPFEVASYDGSKVGAGFGQGMGLASNAAEESAVANEAAYPTYDRMHGSRSTDVLAEHGERSTDRMEVAGEHPQSMYTSRTASPPPIPRVSTVSNDTSVSQRRCMYDLLVFFLFGLLAVLMLHEVAALGESIGAERIAALASDLTRPY